MSDLYGLIGEKLGHSISPRIHAMIFNELGMDACYHLFEIKKDNLLAAVTGLKILGIKGVNVTIPYKIDVMEFLNTISDEARKIGSVNTVKFREGKAAGYNTDYFGFGSMLERSDVEVRSKSAVVLGTGGASKAVINYLLNNGIKDVCIISRNPVKNSHDRILQFSYEDLGTFSGGDLIINCTPCGMHPDTNCSPVDRKILSKFRTAVDLIYNPKETLMLKFAKEMGLKTINGLYMLVGQAVAAEEIWNDIKIEAKIIDNIYNRLV